MRFIIPFAALLTLPFLQIAKADGCDPGTACYRELSRASAPRPRAYPYIKQVASRPWCDFAGRPMSREACREFERAERRGSRRDRAYDDDRPRRADRDDTSRGQCGGKVIIAEGKKVWSWVGEKSAKNEARLQWEREVISALGERYADPRFARKNGDGYTCWEVGRSTRCSFAAKPCKA